MASVYGAGVYGTALYDDVPVGAPVVELFLNGAWVDVTAYVRISDGIRIQRGLQDEQANPQPATCRLTLDNADGRFSSRNAAGAYYPYLKRNTRLRVSATKDDGTTTVRFWGDVPTWPINFDLTGRDVQVHVEAAGPRRLLTVGAVPLKSPYTLAVAGTPNVIGYWPMEDGSTSTMFQTVTGTTAIQAGVSFAADDTFAASEPLPEFTAGTSSARMVLPATTAGVTGQQVRFLWRVAGLTAGSWVAQIDTNGAHFFWLVFAPATNAHQFLMFNYATAALEYTGVGHAFGTGVDITAGMRFSFEVFQNGTGVDVGLHYIHPGDSTAFGSAPETIPATTVGSITGVRFFCPNQLPDGTPISGTPDVATFGQLTVENNITSIYDIGAALTAYAGETAGLRWVRLTNALAIPAAINLGPAPTAVGPQPTATPLQILDDATLADGGISTEAVSSYGLQFRARGDMYSTSLPATLTAFPMSELDSITPIDDDQNLVNDLTVSRPNGSAARVVATAGLTPTAVGTYADGIEVNVNTDDQLADQAGWRVAVGSIDASRWIVGFDALRLTSAERVKLVAVREGDTISLTGLAAKYNGTGTDRMHVLGWTETIAQASWRFEFNAAPAEPWSTVLILDDTTYGILDTDRLAL